MTTTKSIILSILTIAFVSTVYGIAADVIEQLSLQKQNANQHILNNFVGDWTLGDNSVEDTGGTNNPNSIDNQLKIFRIPTMRTLSSIVTGNKSVAAKELCEYVRRYVESPEFIVDYKAKREKAKPTSEPYRPDEAAVKSQKASLKQMEAQYAQMKRILSKEQLAQIEKGMKEMRAQIAEWDDPTPNKTRWLKMYPEDASVMIKNRLEEYLATAATVDFNAQLTPAGRKQKFTDPAYENQSLKWKAIYRAGKDVNDEVMVLLKIG